MRIHPARTLVAAFLTAAAITLTPPAATAGTVAQLAPEQVLGYADSIFEGTVQTARPYYLHGDHGPILTEYTIAITRTLRDDAGELTRRARKAGKDAGGGVIRLVFSGGRIGDVEDLVRGVPKLTVGQRAFFFINKRDWGATSPLVGVHQGLFTVEQHNGREQVVRAGGCCQAAEPVAAHFFAKTRTAPDGFNANEFADEVIRGLDRARLDPDLSFDKPLVAPPMLAAHEHDARTLGVAQPAPAGVTPAVRGPLAEPLPYSSNAAVLAPVIPADQLQFIDPSQFVMQFETRPPISNRYGFFSGSPDFPVTFNIAPNMGEFAGKMEQMLSYWNAHADLFRVFLNPNNSFTWGNDRNEAGFATSAVLNSQQGVNWNTGEYAVCYSRSRSGEIKESDIYYNLDPGNVWTSDYLGAAAQSVANPNCTSPCLNLATYFPSVAIHETGHAFGMEHQFVTNPGATFPSIMNYYPKNRLFDTGFIFADDTLAITSQYGSVPRTNGVLKMWYHDGTMGTSSNTTRWTIDTGVSVQRGANLAVGGGTRFFVVDNTGTGSISPRFDFYLTPNFGSFDGARYLSTATSSPVGARTFARYQVNVPVPVNTPPGQYFVAIAMTAAGDQDGNDNAAWSYNRITITAGSPANDTIAGAIALDARGGVYSGTTFGSSFTFGGACGTSGSTGDVWYHMTPVTSGSLDLNTCGSGYDTVLELFNTSFTNLGCDDDAVSGPCAGTTQSRLIRSVTAGQTYYIRVSGWNGRTGDFTLTARVYPANDTCSVGQFGAPSAVVYANVPAAGTTIGASPSVSGILAPCPVQTLIGPVNVENNNDVWYRWNAVCNTPVQVVTYSNRLLQVAVYSRCYEGAFFPPTLIACGQPTFGFFNPVASFTPVAGEGYTIRVITYDADADFTLSVAQSSFSNDTCTSFFGDPTPIVNVAAGTPSAVTLDTRCAAPSSAGLMPPACGDIAAGFDGGNDLFYRVNIQTTGTLQVTRCDGSYIPVVALYASCPLDQPQSALTCGYSASPSCAPIIINHPVNAGQVLSMRVAGYPNSSAGPSGFTTLTLNIIPDPSTGACCQIDGACAVTAQGDCGAIYQGDDTTCDPNPCAQPTGACCQGGSCTLITDADCAAANGTYQGDGQPCLGDAANPITCCTANFNNQGGVTVQDIFDFLAAYFAGDPAADANNSGTITVQDIFDFLGMYFAGCA